MVLSNWKRVLSITLTFLMFFAMIPTIPRVAADTDLDAYLVFTTDGTTPIPDSVTAGSTVIANVVAGQAVNISTYQLFVNYVADKITMQKTSSEYVYSSIPGLKESVVMSGVTDPTYSMLRSAFATGYGYPVAANQPICSFAFTVSENMTTAQLASYLEIVAQNVPNAIEVNGLPNCMTFFSNDCSYDPDMNPLTPQVYTTNYRNCPSIAASATGAVTTSTTVSEFKSTNMTVTKFAKDAVRSTLTAADYNLYSDNTYTTLMANASPVCSVAGPGVTLYVMTTDGLKATVDTGAVTGGASVLSSISITAPPTKTVYSAFDTFDKTGMVVTAHYSGGATADVTSSCTFDPLETTQLTTTVTGITVSYSSFSAVQSITVNPKQVAKPVTTSAGLTYDGTAKTISYSTPPNSLYTDVTGTTTGTDAGTYNATAALKDKVNTVWSDNTTDDVPLTWEISKASYGASFSAAASVSTTGTTNKTVGIGEFALPAGFVDAKITSISGITGIVSGATVAGDQQSVSFNTPAANEGDTGTVNIRISSKNYTDTTATVSVTAHGVVVDTTTWDKVTAPATAVYGSSNGTIVTIAAGPYTAKDSDNNPLTGSLVIENASTIQSVGARTIRATFTVTGPVGSPFIGTTASKDFSVTINPLEAQIAWNTTNSALGTPYSTAYAYNGATQGIYPFVSNAVAGDIVNVTAADNVFKDAGIHTANASSLDNANYILPAVASKSWQINAKVIYNLSWGTTSFAYSGAPITVTASIGVVELYDGDTCTVTTYTGNTETAVGNYTATATGLSNSNYTLVGCSNPSTAWEISPDVLTGISITTPPTTTAYTAFDKFNPAGMVVTATYGGGSTADVTSSCTFAPSVTEDLKVSNTAITVTYNGFTVSQPITVTPRKIVKPAANTAVVPYDGNEHVFVYTTPPNPTFVSVTGQTTGTAIGTYNASAQLMDPVNTTWDDDTIVNVPLSWTIQSGVYPGPIAGTSSVPTSGITGKPFAKSALNIPAAFINAKIKAVTGTTGIVTAATAAADGQSLTFDTTAAAEGATGTITLTISSDNYADTTATVTVTATGMTVDTTTWDKVTAPSTAVYGSSNGTIATIAAGPYTAKDSDNNPLTGSLAIENASTIQSVGARTIRATFTVTGPVGSPFIGTTASKDFSVTINPLEAQLVWNTTNSVSGTPYSTAYAYNGTTQGIYPFVSNAVAGDTVNVTTADNVFKDVGIHTANASSLDNANYTLPAAASKSWQIKAKVINSLTWGITSFAYSGSPITITASIGAVELYAGDTCTVTTYTGNTETEVGLYTATATGLSNSNYTLTGCTNSSTAWEISVGALTGISIAAPPAKTSYTAFDKFDPTGMVVNATYGGTTTDVTASCTFVPGLTDDLKVSDTSVTVIYNGFMASQPVTVVPKAITAPVANPAAIPYDGAAHTFAYTTPPNSQFVTITGQTSGTAAGLYTAVAALKDKVNTTWADSTTADITLNWSIGKNIYPGVITGTVSSPMTGAAGKTFAIGSLNIPASFTGTKITAVTGTSGIATGATVAAGGQSITFNTSPSAEGATGNITVTISSDNYADCTATITVKATGVTVDTVTWDKVTVPPSLSYGSTNGEIVTIAPGTVTANGGTLQGTLSVTNPTAKPNAGTGSIRVEFTVTGPAGSPYIGTVIEKDYPLTINPIEAQIVWNTTNSPAGTSYTAAYSYNGSTQGVYPFVTNAAPGDVFTIISSNNTGRHAGIHTANITSLGNSNYTLPAVKSKTWQITPKGITSLIWSATELVYTGSRLAIIANVRSSDTFGDACSVITFAGNTGVAVGTYTATATGLSNSDYTLDGCTNKTQTWKIVDPGTGVTGGSTSGSGSNGVGRPSTKPSSVVVTITPSPGVAISPSGSIAVSNGGNTEFTITPNEGYTVEDILFNGVSVMGDATKNEDGTYTYKASNITKSSTLTVVATNGEHGGTDIPDVPDGTYFPFNDVTPSDWEYTYIKTLYDAHIIDGTGYDTFSPDANITRAQFLKILAGVVSADVAGKSTNSFADVPSDSLYMPYIAWAESMGITYGTEPNEFSPDANITREQLASMINRYCTIYGVSLPQNNPAAQFVDSADISGYAADSIQIAQRAGIINGFEDGTFRPQSNTTRAEASKMLCVLYGIVK